MYIIKKEILTKNHATFGKPGKTTGLANFIAFLLFKYLMGIKPNLI